MRGRLFAPIEFERGTLLVKICGIRNDADLDTAVAAGANWLGFLCGLTHKSEDRLEPAEAARLISRVPPGHEAILVTHLTSPIEIAELFREVGATMVQLHGEMTAPEVAETRRLLPQAKLIGVVHVAPGKTATEAASTAQAIALYVNAILIDSRTADRLGGTGVTHDWSISAEVGRAVKVPLVLAGGLRPENVAAAVVAVHPATVDVNSGVENNLGDKDLARCRAFVDGALRAERNHLSM